MLLILSDSVRVNCRRKKTQLRITAGMTNCKNANTSRARHVSTRSGKCAHVSLRNKKLIMGNRMKKGDTARRGDRSCTLMHTDRERSSIYPAIETSVKLQFHVQFARGI